MIPALPAKSNGNTLKNQHISLEPGRNQSPAYLDSPGLDKQRDFDGKRFTRNFRCPICNGYEEAPRGSNERCYGFLSRDGKYAHCTREEHAHGLPLNPGSNAYVHLLEGPCKCGKEHGPARYDSFQARNNNGKEEVIARYDYLDENGELLIQVCRKNPKGFFQRRPDGAGNWIMSLDAGEYYQAKNGEWYTVESAIRKERKIPLDATRKKFPSARRVLYRLPELLKANLSEIPFITEGEKDVHSLEGIGCVATTGPEGAGKWHRVAEQARAVLAGRPVVPLPDNDEKGKAHALDVARSLHGAATSIKVVNLPGLPPKGDVTDWIEARKAEGMIAPEIKAALLEIVAQTLEWTPTPTDVAPNDAGETAQEEEESDAKATVAAILMRLAKDIELSHTDDDRGIATFQIGNHKENAIVKSTAFRRWLAHRFYQAVKKPANDESLKRALDTLEAKAMFEGRREKAYIRTAEYNGNIYIDLCNDDWEAVECTPGGWKVISDPPIKFIRPKGMLPLPKPIRGNARDLERFLNVRQSSDLQLILSWVVNAFRHDSPFPALIFMGEQGTAKSTASELIRALIDPNTAPIRSAPREERDLLVSANAGWVLCFDNLSGLSNAMSDALCRISTGGGLAVRQLYTDSEETIFTAMRPVILNGITDVVSRPDLLDRALIINLEPIPEEKRRTKKELMESFNQAAPAILGGLLDAVCTAIRNLPSTSLPRLPRMADFALYATAAETGLGFKSGDFMNVYSDNQREAVSSSLEVDPLAQAIRELIDNADEFEGTIGGLLERLNAMNVVTDGIQRSGSWPKTPHKLRSSLKRIKPFLEKTGITIEFLGKTGRRNCSTIHLSRETGDEKSAKSAKSVMESKHIDFIEDGNAEIMTELSPAGTPKSPQTPSKSVTKSVTATTIESNGYGRNDGNDGNDGLSIPSFSDGKETITSPETDKQNGDVEEDF